MKHKIQFFRISPNIIFCLQNAYFYTEKKFDTIVGRSTTPKCLGSLRTDFSEFHQIAYLDPKRHILDQNFLGNCSQLLDDSRMPRVNLDRFFRISPNRIFGSQNANFEQKNFHTDTGSLLRSAHMHFFPKL